MEEAKEVQEVKEKEEVLEPEPSSPDAKEVLASQEVERRINWSQAIKEKNQKIQEQKAEIETLRAQLEQVPQKEEINPFVMEDEGTKQIKTRIEELIKTSKDLERQNKDLQTRLDETDKKQIGKEAIMQVDGAISNLKKKYSDFDEMKVIGRIIQKRGENATPDDLEEAYLAMKAEEILLNKKKEEAKSEGSSVVGVEPEVSKPKTYEEAIELEMKKTKTPKV